MKHAVLLALLSGCTASQANPTCIDNFAQTLAAVRAAHGKEVCFEMARGSVVEDVYCMRHVGKGG